MNLASSCRRCKKKKKKLKNEGLFMAGNPFEAPLDLALLARRLPGQICALPSAGLIPPPHPTSSSEEAERGVLAGGCAGHDASLSLAATGGALVLPTLLGRDGWLRALFLRQGGRVLVLMTVSLTN